MLKDWKLIETYCKKGKPYERVEINLFQHINDDNKWSFGVDFMVYSLGSGTPVMEYNYIYQTKQEA